MYSRVVLNFTDGGGGGGALHFRPLGQLNL